MTQLNRDARQVLASAGYTPEEWARSAGWSDGLWRGDACGCDDDRCIGYHHDKFEECGCLPALIEDRAMQREAYQIWQDYRAAVEANDGRGDPKAYDAAWARAETWVRRHYPEALTFSLDAVVNGSRGISATYPGADPGYVGSMPEPEAEGTYRQQLWTAGVNQYGRSEADQLSAQARERRAARDRQGRA